MRQWIRCRAFWDDFWKIIRVTTNPAGLTPIEIGQGVTYKEAKLTFLCKKLYQHQFPKENITTEVQEYYASMPKVYPDFNGGWQPHIVFVGEIIEVRDER
ncbi:hypothetical protein [Ruminococcus sp.]|uniref:hypothetical protein n=1 Tax=Ruminococcus sp. TaxID=41978 RepID=UPI003AF5D4B2